MRTTRSLRSLPPARPTPEQFVRAWQTSSSVAEVAMKLRMKKAQCRVRACRYRQRGVLLKQFPPVEIPAVDWEALAKLAADLARNDGSSAAPATPP
jgi:hypothetical protein